MKSASYFNSLDPAGTKDETQRLIRPRFLQMIVLLLSLLNDEDLGEIRDFLQSTYGINADRGHIEMLFLKVIPLLSINSKVFLKELVSALEGIHIPDPMEEQYFGYYWDTFVRNTLQKGYILPGGVADLGSGHSSWVPKWPEEGIKSSEVFNGLQYAGSAGGKLRTFNDIPPLELRPEQGTKDLTVVLTNNEKYLMNPMDLEQITLLSVGVYSLREAQDGGRHADLQIFERVLSHQSTNGVDQLNYIISQWNNWRNSASGQSSILRPFHRGKIRDLPLFQEYRSQGRLTQNIADLLLNGDRLAISYKINGHKITRNNAIQILAQEARKIKEVVHHIESHLPYFKNSTERSLLTTGLERVLMQVTQTDDIRHQLANEEMLDDEPIDKVLHPQGVGTGTTAPWNEYRTWLTNNLLHVQAKRSVVTAVIWLSESLVEIGLQGHQAKYTVAPLQAVEEGWRDDEIRKGDLAILVGSYLVLAVPNEDPQAHGVLMTNYLRIVSEEAFNRTRRGMNRQAGGQVACVTRFC